MAMELTAVRLLAPWFGDSAFVWTNTIGVILVALALGAWLGGVLADRAGSRSDVSGATEAGNSATATAADPALRCLSVLFGLAAALVCITPWVAPSLGGFLLPRDLPLDAAQGALVRGSLAATLLLFAPPIFLLGCLTPLLVSSVVRGGQASVGRGVGWIGACSTLGSLVGTFGATHWAVPGIGSRATLWLCAAILAAAGLLAFWRSLKGARPASAQAAALLGVLALAVGSPWFSASILRPAAEGTVLIDELESAYQFLQVLDVESQDARILAINEGLDSFHSVQLQGTVWTGGRYYDWHTIAPFLAGDGVARQPLRVLSLGDAAGTFDRLFGHAFDNVRFDAVELDAGVVELGERWFETRPSTTRVFAGLDARVFVNHAPDETYDVVLVDAYERQVYIPAHVGSLEFFTAVRRVLRPGGVVSVNSGGLSPADPVPHHLATTMAAVFGSGHVFRVPNSRNLLLCARRDVAMDPAATLASARTPLSEELRQVLQRAQEPQRWSTVLPDPDGVSDVLVDDRPLLDHLHDLAGYVAAGDEALTVMAGAADPIEIEDQAREVYGSGGDSDVLALLATASDETPLLRYLAGSSRWRKRDLMGARREYERALELAPEAELTAALQGNLEGLQAELQPREHAAEVATRNGLLALGAALLVAVAGWFGARLLSERVC